MSNREQTREIKDFFGGNVELSHGTLSTTATVVSGEADLLQIQIDTTHTETSASSIQVDIDGTTVKRRGMAAGVGTAEITFMGRRKRVTNGVELTRPGGDSHTLFYTVVYRPVP
jgi:hypothetical protein